MKDPVKGVMLISFPVQAHWRKMESACFVSESDLQERGLVSVFHPAKTFKVCLRESAACPVREHVGKVMAGTV